MSRSLSLCVPFSVCAFALSLYVSFSPTLSPKITMGSSVVYLYLFQPVQQIVSSGGKVQGVVLQDGTEIRADIVLSNATPKVTYLDLTDSVSTVAFYSVHMHVN